MIPWYLGWLFDCTEMSGEGMSYELPSLSDTIHAPLSFEAQNYHFVLTFRNVGPFSMSFMVYFQI